MNTQKRWIIKWGLLDVQSKNLERLENVEELQKEMEKVATEVRNVFVKSSKVFDIKFTQIYGDDIVIRDDYDGNFDTHHPILLTLKIPEKEIYVPSFIPKEDADFGTDFKVIYDGNFYLIFWEVEANKRFYEGGPSVRDCLKDIITESDILEAESVPPTPFRQEFLFDFQYDEKYKKWEMQRVKDNFVVVNMPPDSERDKFFLWLYRRMAHVFLFYFISLRLVRRLERIIWDIYNINGELLNEVSYLNSIRFYHIFRASKMKVKIKDRISNLLEEIADYQTIYSQYLANKGERVHELKSSFFKIYFDDFMNELKHDKDDMSVIFNSINYFGEVLKSVESSYIYIIGVIIGGLMACLGIFLGVFMQTRWAV